MIEPRNPTKVEVLDVLLSTSALAQELFDVADVLGSTGLDSVATRENISKVTELRDRLEGLRMALTVRYVHSGKASDDFLGHIRESLDRTLDG